MVTFTI